MRLSLAVAFGICSALSVAAQETAQPATPAAGSPTSGRSLEFPVLLNQDLPDGSARGSCATARITLAEQREGNFRIGFFETEVGGSGAQWRSAGWMSACVAAQLSGFDPSTTNLSFDVNGRIDGPSAGCVMTVGVLAAVRGDTILPNVCMTGTINPDGTVGPVGRIPQKIIGAKEVGKTLMLIPGNCRREFDVNQQKVVDLVAHGREHGVEVQQVDDIYTAYELLTGKSLPRLPAADHPALTADVERLLVPYIEQWTLRYQQKLEEYQQADEDYNSDYSRLLVETAAKYALQGQQLLNEGEFCGAYQASTMAAFTLANSLECIRNNSVKDRKGLDEAKRAVRTAVGAVRQIDLLTQQLRETQPKTVGEAGMYLGACGCLVEATSLCLLAEDVLARTTEDETEAFDWLAAAGEHYQRAVVLVQLAKEGLEMGPKLPGAPMPAEAPLLLAAEFFQHAADANLQVFEDVHILPRAKAAGLTAEQVRYTVMAKDEFYARMRTMADRAALPVYQRLGNTPAFAYARLATSLHSYTASSLMIAKYYSGLVTFEEEGGAVSGIAKEKTLLRMLDFAEDQARRSIHSLVDRGADASVCINTYKVGRLNRQREVSDQLDALVFLWDAHVYAQALSYLGGFAGPPKEDGA